MSPLNPESSDYFQAMFDLREQVLKKQRLDKWEGLRGGLIAMEDIEKRVGQFEYTELHIESANKLADARAECLCVAFEHEGNALDKAIIDEVLSNVSLYIEGFFSLFMSNERFRLSTAAQTDAAVSKRLSYMQDRTLKAAMDIHKRLKDELTVKMYEQARKSPMSEAPSSQSGTHNYHLYGSNPRVNVNSLDRSINTSTLREDETKDHAPIEIILSVVPHGRAWPLQEIVSLSKLSESAALAALRQLKARDKFTAIDVDELPKETLWMRLD